MKIISGGQTGVDRAALDVALKHGISAGGWCPAGRLDEIGRIPERYPVTELSSGGFHDRTLANVRDSDGTVIFYFRELTGGSEHTVQCCFQHKRPHLIIDAATVSAPDAGNLIVDFINRQRISTLNVAGPRQSEWPEGYDYALVALESFLRLPGRPN